MRRAIPAFLKLFYDHRCLLEANRMFREANEKEHGNVREIQGQLGELRDEVRRLKEERDNAAGQERNAYQMLINVEYKQKYGITPFPDAPSIPDVAEVDMTPVGGSMSARAATKAGRETFRAELAELFKQGETQ